MKIYKEYWEESKETLVLIGNIKNVEIRAKFSADLISEYIFDRSNTPATWHNYSKKLVKFVVEYYSILEFYVVKYVFPHIEVQEGQEFPTIVIVNVQPRWFRYSVFKNLFCLWPKKSRRKRNIDKKEEAC